MKNKTRLLVIVIAIIALLVLAGGLAQWYLDNNLVVSVEETHSHAHVDEGDDAGASADVDAPVNLVTNYSFEVGSGFDLFGWQATGEESGAGVWWDDNVSLYGYHSASLTNSDLTRGTDLTLFQYLDNVPAGRDVTVKGSVRTEALSGNAFLQLIGSFEDEQESRYLVWLSLDEVSGSTDWHTVEGSAYLPAEVTSLMVSVGIYGEGKAWFDGISVTSREHAPAPLPRDTNLLINGDFDQSTLHWHYFAAVGAPGSEWSVGGSGESSPFLCIIQDQPVEVASYSGFYQTVNGLDRSGGEAVLSGWVRTEDLEGEALLSLAFLGKNGRTDIVSTIKPFGSTEWQLVEVACQVPPDSDCALAQLISVGRGTACFDGLSLKLTGSR